MGMSHDPGTAKPSERQEIYRADALVRPDVPIPCCTLYRIPDIWKLFFNTYHWFIYIYGVCIYVYVYIYIVIYGGCIFFVYMSIGWLFLLEHLSPKRCRQVRHLHCDDHQARCTLVPWGWLLKIDRFPWKPGNHGVNIPLHRVLHAIYCNIIDIYI